MMLEENSDSKRDSNIEYTVENLAGAILFTRSLLQEIRKIWPAQTKSWPNNADLERSWARSIVQSNVSPGQLKAAFTRLSAKPFPCDLGALIDDALSGGISLTTAKLSLSKTCQALGAANYSLLTSIEYAAACKVGFHELKHLSLTLDAIKEWRAVLAELSDRTDLPKPPTPAPKLPRQLRTSEIGRQYIKTIKQSLNVTSKHKG